MPCHHAQGHPSLATLLLTGLAAAEPWPEIMRRHATMVRRVDDGVGGVPAPANSDGCRSCPD
jgi:hypothetical protein